jgi:polyphenol oxidase
MVFKFSTDALLNLGTVGKSLNTIDYSEDLNTVRNHEIELLGSILSINKNNIIILNQVHGDRILKFSKPLEGERIFPNGDGMITDAEKLCLVIRTADCVPVFAFDVKQRVLGAAHSGWKGCSLGISRKLIRNMKSGYKSENKNLHIYILPSIGPESYTVNMDVGSLFKDDITLKNDKVYLNLWNNIKKSLIKDGIPEANLNIAGICNYINHSDFFSYRRGDAGRNLNFAMIT